MPFPEQSFVYKAVDAGGKALKPIAYKDLNLNAPWDSLNIEHELTSQGIRKFVADYESTIRRSA